MKTSLQNKKRNERIIQLNTKSTKTSQTHPKKIARKIIFKKLGLIEMPYKDTFQMFNRTTRF